MNLPLLDFIACADSGSGHRMAYWQWGDPAASHVVLCLHGLTRQGRDFDVLAQVLLAQSEGALRIICPDVAGRGHSDWLADPQGYQLPQYAADMALLLAQLHARSPIHTLDLIGTSMGGLISMALAGHKELPLPVPVRKFVINDVGPAIELAAIERIASYVGQVGRFPSVQAAADAMWQISASFGPHTPQEWLALSRPMLVSASERSADGLHKVPASDPSALQQGPFVLHYDPSLALPFRAITPQLAAEAEVATWALYDAIRADTLLLRGSVSDLLSHQTARAMTERGPRARLVEFEGVGHAPTLVAPAQTAVVSAFVLA